MATADAFEKRRKELGLSSGGSSDLEQSFQYRQMELGLIPDTRPKQEKEKKKQKTQAEAHDFGNQAGSVFDGKLPASSLLTVGTGGPKNASELLPANPTEYDIEQQRIDQSKAPGIVKYGAGVLNSLGRDTTAGKFITNLFPSDPLAVQRDSTGNKTLDKIDNIAAAYLTPATIPIGAPLGQGIIGGSYEAAGKALSKGLGQKAVNSAASVIPKVSPDVAQNIARVGLTEGLAGAVQGAGLGMQQGQDKGAEILRNAALGAAGGLVLGGGTAAAGEGLGAIVSRFRKAGINEDEIAKIAPEILALPEGRGTARQTAAVGRSNLPEGTEPIATPYTFKLGEATPETQAAAANRNSIQSVDPVYLNTKYAQEVIDEYKALKDSLNNRQSIGTKGRSQNPEWYRTFQKENGKTPSLREIYDLARQNVDQRRPSGTNVTEGKLFDTRRPVAESAHYQEPIIRNTQITREQEIYNKVISGGHPTPDEMDFMLSDEFNNDNIFPDTTPTTSTYVKPQEVDSELLTKSKLYQQKGEYKNSPDFSMEELKEKLLSPSKTDSVNIQDGEVNGTVLEGTKSAGERGFATTLKGSEKTPVEFKENLNSTYTPTSNQKSVDVANQKIAADADAAAKRILSIKKFDADSSATAQRLIDHFNKLGDYETSVDIADKIATEATKAGQFIQSLSIYNRLTPEGVLIHARRIANRVNETSSKLGRQAEVTPKMAEDIVSLAGVTQNMTGIKDLSNNVIDILEKAKSGEKLTSSETDTLSKFVNESKQFIKETTKPAKPPRAPAASKDKRVRDNVASFLDAQEQAAKERLRAKGIRISSTPLDIWADYAVIGAAKMGKNIVKFADWSEQMVKDLGEGIRPQLSQLYESSKEAFNLTSKKISRQTISDAERLTQKIIKEKQLTGDEVESLLNIAQRVSALSGEAKRTASQDLQAILQSLDKPSFLRKIASAQTQAQLLNPKTQVRNVVGNELFYRLERLNKYVATPIDIARSKLTGSARTVTFRSNNQGQYWYNFMSGGKAGWKGVNINGLETQFDLASPAFTGKYNPLKYTEKALGASLRSFDNAAYSRAANKSLGELATLDAINKGVKPTKDYVKNYIAQADENIIQIADNYGKYVTFQDNNIISKGLTGLKRGLNAGKDFGFGDLVLKYPKTPGALLMRALEYSPVGFLRSAKIVAEPLLRNGIEKNPAEATQALSRAIIGTFGLSGLGYFLIDNDILTGQASKDRDIRSLQSQAGQGQYQVNLSALYRFVQSKFDPNAARIKEGDLLYNYDWMQPVSVAISMGANINKNLSEGSAKGKVAAGALTAGYQSVAGGINTLTEQSVLQGLARAAEGYPGQTVTDKIADVLSDVPASFIPTLSNQIKQATDNTKRETTDPTLLEQTLNKAQAKIPGLAGKLPKKYDTLGAEQTHYQDNSLVNVFLNPGFPSRYKLTPEAKMIVDLITDTGDESVAPRVPDKKIDGTKLTGEQFSRLSKLQGDESKERISKVKPTLSTESKVKKVRKQLTNASSDAKKQLFRDYPGLLNN